MKINSHILRFQGKAELPEEVQIGHNYRVVTEGAITNFTQSDNEDGTHDKIYTYKPVRIEMHTPTGLSLTLKDSRSKSQLWRARVWGIWKTQNISTPFEQFYDTLMDNMIIGGAEIIEMYQKANS